MLGYSEGVVVHRRVWAPGLVTLGIEVAVEPLRPGQFHNVALPVGDAWVRRAYSVASAPGERLELYVARIEGGDLSPELTDLPEGSRVWVEPKPRGFFTLDHVPTVPELWMVATGTGLGPYVAMLRTPGLCDRFERVVLVHGVREGSHLAYADELAAREREWGDRLTRVIVVSREDHPGALRGRITARLRDGSLETRAQLTLSPERSHLLLCGNPAMIEELVPLLAERGLVRHRARSPGHVTFERYW